MEYHEIAKDYPTRIVGCVTLKYRRGLIPGQSTEFPPKPPQFAQALRSEPFHGEDEHEWARGRAGVTEAPRLEYAKTDRETKQERWRRKGREKINEVMADWDEANGWHDLVPGQREELNRKRIAEFMRRRGGAVPGLGEPERAQGRG